MINLNSLKQIQFKKERAERPKEIQSRKID
jgi:hypothetical protein